MIKMSEQKHCSSRLLSDGVFVCTDLWVALTGSWLCMWGRFSTISLLKEGLWLWLNVHAFGSHSAARTWIHVGTQNALQRTFIWLLVKVKTALAKLNNSITDCFCKFKTNIETLRVWRKLQVLIWMKEQKRTASGSNHICKRHRTRLDFLTGKGKTKVFYNSFSSSDLSWSTQEQGSHFKSFIIMK